MRLVIIGAGPGGNGASVRAKKLGADVTLVEDTEVGGTCLNRGCIPTKTLLYSSSLYSKAMGLDKYGIKLEGTVTPDLAAMMERKDKVVSTQVRGLRASYKTAGINIMDGRARLIQKNIVEVTAKDGSTETIETDKVIIATGSRPAEVPSFPFDGDKILSSDDALRLTSIPGSMIIVGAGVIGCEFASIYRDLGTEVTMVELLPRPLATEDTEISVLLTKEFKKKKIKILTGIGVSGVATSPVGVRTTLTDGSELKAEKMLVAVGRSFNSGNMGLEEAGVKLAERSNIEVDERMETSVEGIYAIGDVAGKWLLAHTAYFEGLVAAENACGLESEMDYTCVPSAVFTTPEIGSVGLRDFQAEEQEIDVVSSTYHYRTLGKAHTMGEIAGFFKIISEAHSDRLLGAHIAGAHASDLIHEAALAIRKGLTAKDIAETIHAHPTLSEGLMEAAINMHD
ncbi:dihydrolipoyl dehydrogenase [Nitrospirota bacterium]